jgi:hypothetical protein
VAQPLEAFSRILDEGLLIFAVLTAVSIILVLQLSRAAEFRREETKSVMRDVQAHAEASSNHTDYRERRRYDPEGAC